MLGDQLFIFCWLICDLSKLYIAFKMEFYGIESYFLVQDIFFIKFKKTARAIVALSLASIAKMDKINIQSSYTPEVFKNQHWVTSGLLLTKTNEKTIFSKLQMFYYLGKNIRTDDSFLHTYS